MTRISVGRAGAAWQLAVEGHAQYNPGGPDIVCGAASMLCCALGRALAECGEVRIVRGPGAYELTAWPRSEREWGMIRVAEMGFEMLAEKYPRNVEICGQ